MSSQYLIIASILGWGVGSFLFKIANTEIHPLMVSTLSLGVYALLVPLIWFFMKFDHAITTTGLVVTILGSLFMCVGTMGFSYACRAGGAAGQVTILTALYPGVTLLLSMYFLKEEVSFKQGIGIGFALVGFLLMSRK
jgi:transporter family protein